LQTLRGWDGSMRPDGGSTRAIRKHATFLQQGVDLPKEKIWSGLNMARHVRNQGDCGSCWAIAAATVLEGHAEIYTGKPRTFSAQQIVACTPNPRHCGGDGGLHPAQELQHSTAGVTCLCFGSTRQDRAYMLLAVGASDGSAAIYRCYRTKMEQAAQASPEEIDTIFAEEAEVAEKTPPQQTVRPATAPKQTKEQESLRQEKHAQDSLAVVNDAISKLNALAFAEDQTDAASSH